MSYNGSGTFNINSSGQPVVGGTTITSTAFNALTADVATGLSTAICKDGQTTVTANIPMASHKFTGLSDGSARSDSANIGNVVDGTGVYVGTVGGTADVITLTPNPAITAYTAGQTFRFLASGANTTNVTVNVSGLGAKAITKNGTTALAAGDIPSGMMVELTYDGTRFILESAATSTINSPTINTPTLTSPTLAGTPVFPDNIFTVGGSGDATKKLAFEVDGITTGTTRTVTAQNANGTMAYLTDAFTTGDVKLTFKTAADSTWVLMDDGTIGSATSGATTRANADTETLYTLLWTNIADQWVPVTGGRGASAAADFAANKPLALPKTLGRALAGYGTGVVTASGGDGGVDLTGDTFTVDSNNTKWVTGMSVVFTLSSGTITGLTSGNTYYIIRSSATLVQLASSLANAQNGTAVNMTAKSSPVWTLTHTYTTRALGETGGEESHAMSSTELLAHTHTAANGSNTQGGGAAPGGSTTTSGSTGGNAAMNIMQPTMFLNVMIKL